MKWPTTNLVGHFALRLTVTDLVGHTRQAQVTINVRPDINSKNGGGTESADGNARIYIPPNSLAVPQIITINPEPEIQDTIPPDLTYIGVAYDFGPEGLQFNSKPAKPALITISYAESLRQPNLDKMIGLYRWGQGEIWKRVGGTLDVKNHQVSAPVMELGRYAIMEADAGEGIEGAIENLIPNLDQPATNTKKVSTITDPRKRVSSL